LRFTKTRVLFTWFIIIMAWLWTITLAMLLPLITSGTTALFSILDQLTHGLASTLLLVLILPGLAITLWHIFEVLRVSRSKTSAIHVGMSTMTEMMFKGDSEKRARGKFDGLMASPDPHIFLWVPTDKRVDGKVRQEVKT